jgi:hypothetical protein
MMTNDHPSFSLHSSFLWLFFLMSSFCVNQLTYRSPVNSPFLRSRETHSCGASTCVQSIKLMNLYDAPTFDQEAG